MNEKFAVVIIIILLALFTIKGNYSTNTLLKLKDYCKVKNKKFNIYRLIYCFIIILPTSILLFYKIYLLALIVYVVNLFAVNKVVKIFSNYNNELIAEISEYATLLIRELSINNNLGYIIEEANQSFNGVIIKDIFKTLHEDILKYGEIKAIKKSLNETSNIWIYSIIYSLQSYILEGNKANILDGLDEIVEILDEQINLFQETKVKNNPIVLSNYIITVIGLLGFALNLIANPYAYNYFFLNVKGQIMIILADILLYVIIIINMKMSKGENT